MKRVIIASNNLNNAPSIDNPHYRKTIYKDAVDFEQFDKGLKNNKGESEYLLYVFYDTPGQIHHRVGEFLNTNGYLKKLYLDDFEAAQDYLNDGGSPDKVKYTIGDTTFQVQKKKKSILVSQPNGSWEMPRTQAARLYEQLYRSNKGDN